MLFSKYLTFFNILIYTARYDKSISHNRKDKIKKRMIISMDIFLLKKKKKLYIGTKHGHI